MFETSAPFSPFVAEEDEDTFNPGILPGGDDLDEDVLTDVPLEDDLDVEEDEDEEDAA